MKNPVTGNRSLKSSPLQTTLQTITNGEDHCPRQSGNTKLCDLPKILGILVFTNLNSAIVDELLLCYAFFADSAKPQAINIQNK